MTKTTLAVRTDAPIGVISPRLYGHFAEHLGRCCYGGLWCGLDDSSLPQQNGFRLDVVEALRGLPLSLIHI